MSAALVKVRCILKKKQTHRTKEKKTSLAHNNNSFSTCKLEYSPRYNSVYYFLTVKLNKHDIIIMKSSLAELGQAGR